MVKVKVLKKSYLPKIVDGKMVPTVCDIDEEIFVNRVNDEDITCGLYVPISAAIEEIPISADLQEQVKEPEPTEEITEEQVNNHANFVRKIISNTVYEEDEKGRPVREGYCKDNIRHHLPLYANGGVNFKPEGEEIVPIQTSMLVGANGEPVERHDAKGDIDILKTLGIKIIGRP
jgi:hypothetical protein